MYANVDVIVGGQYGSEGKGHIVSYLARRYDTLLRVGGPNAGHSVFHEEHGKLVTYHVPAGCVHNEHADLVIGPGALINLEKLEKEIEAIEGKMGTTFVTSRLHIHEAAMVIDSSDMLAEGELGDKIGSTKQGVGWATARRVLRDTYGVPTRRMRDIEEWKPFVISENVYRNLVEDRRVMLEGTQGTMLSLLHGPYPHVTSRDTTVSGCLSEAGIAPGRVDRTWVVFRTFPIRVASPEKGTSGPMHGELTWDEVATKSGYPVEDLVKAEKTTTTKRMRRVSLWDWHAFKRALQLNSPDELVLTFCDYHGQENREAVNYTDLLEETKALIREMDNRARDMGLECDVSHVSVGWGPPDRMIIEI